MTIKFVTIMEQIGKDALKVLTEVEKYLVPAAELAAEIFPQDQAVIAGVVNSVGLIQKAVAMAEQKMAAANMQTGTGLQKAADVISIVEPTVTQLLTAEGLKVDTVYIQKLTDAVVGILNVRAVTQMNPSSPAAAA
jgi:hypothetical protein